MQEVQTGAGHCQGRKKDREKERRDRETEGVVPNRGDEKSFTRTNPV